jgi:FkbM family methyltransferase
MTTLRTLLALEGWSLRGRYLALAISGRLGRPLDAEKLFGIRLGMITETSSGYRFKPRPGTADSVTVLPFHELLTRRWITNKLRGKPGGVFIDVGAHCGSFCIQLERGFEKVLAFEPLPSNLKALAENILLNQLEKKISIVPSAVSARSGSAKFQIFSDDTSSLDAGHPGQSEITVPLTTLDEELPRLAIPSSSVRLVKIDVEGTEVDVRAGASALLRDGSPVVLTEANTKEAEAALVRNMQERGYKLDVTIDGRNLLFSK